MDLNDYIDNIHDLSKEVCIITDGNSKSGFELANILTNKGATVILGVDHIGRGRRKAEQLNELNPLGNCIPMEIKLNSLRDIRMFAKDIHQRFSSISILIHNANSKNNSFLQTVEGIESHFGINYLSLFALTGLLFEHMLSARARIITVVPFIKWKDKIQFSHFYHPKNKKAKDLYVQSILAEMFFAKKLDERIRHHKKLSSSILCYVDDENIRYGKENKKKQALNKAIIPIIYSATNDKVQSGDEIGFINSGRKSKEIAKMFIVDDFYNSTIAENLWVLSEGLTGVTYRFK